MPDHVFSQKVTDSQHINLKPAAPTPHEFAAVDHEWLSAGSLVPPAPSAASSSTQNESVMELLQSAPEPSAVALMKPLPQLSAVALADTPHVLSVVALMQPLARQAPGVPAARPRDENEMSAVMVFIGSVNCFCCWKCGFSRPLQTNVR